MNSRTAKLLNRYARLAGDHRRRQIKKTWNRTPRPERAAIRREMKFQVG